MFPIRICLLVGTWFSPIWNEGPGFFFSDLSKILIKGGHEVTVLTLPWRWKQGMGKVRTLNAYLRNCIHLILHGNYDFVIAPFWFYRDFMRYFFLSFVRTQRIFVVCGSDWFDFRSKYAEKNFYYRFRVWLNERLWTAILRKASAIVSSPDLLDKVGTYFSVDKYKLEYIELPVDTEKFNQKVKPIFSIDVNKKVLIHISRLVEGRGLRCLLKALPFVIDYDSKIELLLIGDGPLRKELVSLANELGITDKVKFIGRIAHEDVPKYIAASDIGIQSASEGGGLGNVVREIMAMRKPIVTANIHMQIKQVFVDQKCGLVISDPNDCRDLADKIIIYLSDEEERTIRAANAYNYIVQNASYPAVSKKWNKLLINLKHPDIEYSKN